MSLIALFLIEVLYFAESDPTLPAPISTEKRNGKSGRKNEAGNGMREGDMESH